MDILRNVPPVVVTAFQRPLIQCHMSTKKRVGQTYARCREKAPYGFLTCWRHHEFEELIGNLDQTHEEERSEECPVCFRSMADEIRSLDCGHWVHKECIIKSGKALCPMYRAHVTMPYPDLYRLYEHFNKLAIEQSYIPVPGDEGRNDLYIHAGEEQFYLE